MSQRSGEVHGVLSFDIEPIRAEGRARLLQDLVVLLQGEPPIEIKVSGSEERLVISGEDELQLREARRRILDALQVEVGEPRVAFRETIRKTAEAEGKYIRQTGGSGNYGHVKIRVEPNEPGAGFEFVDAIKGGVVPKEYIKPTEQGIREALTGGILAGYEMVDFKAVLYDGSYHDVDSNEMAFKIAGSMAFKEAARKASPVLLEPVMAVEVTVPEEHMGTIIGDINSRRGRIEGMEHSGGSQVIKAMVPLKEAARKASPVLLEPVMAVEVTVPEEHMGTIIGDINSRRGRIEGMEHSGGSQVIKAMVPLKEMLTSSAYGRPGYAMRFAGYEPAPPRHGPFDDDAAAYARKPRGPGPGSNSAAAKRE